MTARRLPFPSLPARRAALLAAFALAACAPLAPSQAPEPEDPHAWLEEVASDRALAWVRERNAATEALLASQPGFAELRARLLEVFQSRERIPEIQRIGGHVYNLWTDADRPRGLWRRTTLESYRRAEPAWEPVLDLDALAASERENWVWAGFSCLPARTEAATDRCLIGLSRGGADARVYREFDLRTQAFVPGGFQLAEAKSQVAWVDRDTLYVATDTGAGSLNRSGYPREFRRWVRGQPLQQAPVVFGIGADDAFASVAIDDTPGFGRHLFRRAIDFQRNEWFELRGGQLQRLPIPEYADITFRGDLLLLELRRPLAAGATTFPAGALVATRFSALARGEPRYEVLFEPTATRSLVNVELTREAVLLEVIDNVAGGLEELREDAGGWRRRTVPLPGPGTLWAMPLVQHALERDPLAEHYLLRFADFLTPTSLLLVRTGSDGHEVLKRQPALFEAQGMRVEQLAATSRDGTRIPYFVVWPRGATADGDNPTLLTAYGGFQQSQRPSYRAAAGRAWLARGGVFVLANIRGGGEFGPAWHLAAVREHRQRSFDDFLAVAEDLVARRITSPRRLGIRGASNGGLLVGAAFTQRPDLFGAAASHVPLLDMRRYTRLLAGPSWVAEYGDPDRPADWAYLQRYSPYHQVRAGTKYPRPLFLTSTRDDRVHPAHARKMAARMLAQGHEVLYYENIEGGHAGAADARQLAHLQALEFSYLWLQLGAGRPGAAASTSPASR